MNKKRVFAILSLLLTTALSAQFNQFRYYYGTSPYTPAATVTSSSVTIPYALVVTNYLLQAPSVASGGRLTGQVYLQNASGSYFAGEFHHYYGYNSSGYGITAPGYPANPAPFPEQPYAGTYSPLVTGSTAVIPISSACIPNGTYTVRLELYHLSVTEEVPHGASVAFNVNGSVTNPTPVIQASQWDVYVGYLGGGSLGSVTITGSGSSFGATATTTLGTCSGFGSINVTATPGVSPYTLTYRKVTSPNNYGTPVSVTSATTSITATGVAPGQYDILITDGNGCEVVKQITMGASPAPTITITPPAQTVSVGTCLGLNATVSPSGSYAYTWSHSNLTTSAHTIANTAYVCATIPLPGGTGRYRPNTYQVNVSNAYCSGSATRIITADSYYMNTSGNGCCAPAGRFGSNGDSATAVYNVYPNPTSGQLTVSFTGLERTNLTIEIYDLTGKLMSKQAVSDGSTSAELDVKALPSGIYLIRLYSGDEELMNDSFVRE